MSERRTHKRLDFRHVQYSKSSKTEHLKTKKCQKSEFPSVQNSEDFWLLQTEQEFRAFRVVRTVSVEWQFARSKFVRSHSPAINQTGLRDRSVRTAIQLANGCLNSERLKTERKWTVRILNQLGIQTLTVEHTVQSVHRWQH